MKSQNTSEAWGYAPGHITGLFSIYDSEKDWRAKGSRGLGICIDRGAVAKVKVSAGGGIFAQVNGKRAKVTEFAIKKALEEVGKEYRVEAEIKTYMPEGQGFGMSGAGTLATMVALGKILRLQEEQVLLYSHMAEIVHRTGLGDVVAEYFGGAEVRVIPGIPPYGMIETLRVPKDLSIYVGVVGERIRTSKVLSEIELRRRINSVGDDLLEEFLDSDRSLEEMISLSYEFCMEIGLASERVKEALKEIWSSGGMGSQCMIGNSIFAIGENSEEILRKYGEVYKVKIGKGARVLRVRSSKY